MYENISDRELNIDMVSALEAAMKDSEVRSLHFIASFTQEIALFKEATPHGAPAPRESADWRVPWMRGPMIQNFSKANRGKGNGKDNGGWNNKSKAKGGGNSKDKEGWAKRKNLHPTSTYR